MNCNAMAIVTKKTVRAGQPGTQKWLRKCGNALVCVRYKYDAEKRRKIKTIDLVVSDEPRAQDSKMIPKNKIVSVEIRYGEKDLGRVARAAGAVWNRKEKIWRMIYRDAVNLGLEDRIIG